MKQVTRHSVVGCAIGFGLAGSAVGFFAGNLWFAADDRWLAPEWVASMRKFGMVSYWYIFRTIPVGWLLGTISGMWYAVRANRDPG
jgi:hypothetical protein